MITRRRLGVFSGTAAALVTLLSALALAPAMSAQAAGENANISPTNGLPGTVITVTGTGWNSVGPGYTDTVCVFQRPQYPADGYWGGGPAPNDPYGWNCQDQPGGHVVAVAVDGSFATTITAQYLGAATNDVWVQYYEATQNGWGTFGQGPTFTFPQLVPGVPQRVAAMAMGPNAIRVSWLRPDATGAGIMGYAVTNGVTSVDLPAQNSQGMLVYVWRGLSPGIYMCFAVTAKNQYGQSAWSDQACTSTPAPPGRR